MRLMRRKGQSIGEYAILIGIVLGAVFAMQNFIRNHLAGGLQAKADEYLTGGDATATAEDISTRSDSVSTAEMDFTAADTGRVETGSRGKSGTTGLE